VATCIERQRANPQGEVSIADRLRECGELDSAHSFLEFFASQMALTVGLPGQYIHAQRLISAVITLAPAASDWANQTVFPSGETAGDSAVGVSTSVRRRLVTTS
jgi:hypothetical protein